MATSAAEAPAPVAAATRRRARRCRRRPAPATRRHTAARRQQHRPPADAVGQRAEDQLAQSQHQHVDAEGQLDHGGRGLQGRGHGRHHGQVHVHRQRGEQVEGRHQRERGRQGTGRCRGGQGRMGGHGKASARKNPAAICLDEAQRGLNEAIAATTGVGVVAAQRSVSGPGVMERMRVAWNLDAEVYPIGCEPATRGRAVRGFASRCDHFYAWTRIRRRCNIRVWRARFEPSARPTRKES